MGGDIIYLSYIPHVLQVVAPQLEQELPPVGEVSPFASFDREAKVENTRLAFLWQTGHEASLLTWLKLRNNSNLSLQPEQTYSYIGILFPPR